jgi:iron complex outermembrane receptor protein
MTDPSPTNMLVARVRQAGPERLKFQRCPPITVPNAQAFMTSVPTQFFKRAMLVLQAAVLTAVTWPVWGQEETGARLEAAGGWMDLDELLATKVISVSRTEQTSFTTPAAVHVITRADLERSGALNLPDALRLAPGVESAFVNSRLWAVTIRGFNGAAATKLLPMIDGRSIYNMRFSGTIWDTRDVMLEDVERIEVIRGPGGTAWGANAVNGVINVITRSARDTQGTLVSGGGGTFERAFVAARHGFAVGEQTWMRVYADAFQRADSEPVVPADANDAWWQSNFGFRLDSEVDLQRRLMVAGKYFFGEGDQFVGGAPDTARSQGGFAQARYEIDLDAVSRFSAQVYYDGLRRDSGGAYTESDLMDGELQYDRTLAETHTISLGANYRVNRLFDEAQPIGQIPTYDPPERWLNQFGAFLQDEWRVVPERVAITGGIKAEYNDFTGWEPLPSLRGAWTPTERQTVWAAVSRAVRIPSRSDNDLTVVIPVPGLEVRSEPSPDLMPEVLWAYEAGYRIRPAESLSFDLALFYQDYDDLFTSSTTVIPSPPTLLSVRVNDGSAESYGGELAVRWEPYDWWHLQLGYSHLELQAHAPDDPGAETVEDRSPANQASLLSSWELGPALEVDAWLRFVDEIPAYDVDAHLNLDVRLAWRPAPAWEVSVVGQNLLHESRFEFQFLVNQQWARPRGVYGRLKWEF